MLNPRQQNRGSPAFSPTWGCQHRLTAVALYAAWASWRKSLQPAWDPFSRPPPYPLHMWGPIRHFRGQLQRFDCSRDTHFVWGREVCGRGRYHFLHVETQTC
jgi:hypothetical protein